MDTLFLDRIPADTAIIISLFVGSVARLCDGQARTPMAAIRELFFGNTLGAFIAGLVSKFVHWPLIDFWFVAGLAAFFSSVLVGVVEKKMTQIRDMSLKETAHFVIKETLAEIRKYLPSKK